VTVDSNPALRKDDDLLPAFHRVDEGAGGQRVGRVNGDDPGKRVKEFEQPILCHEGVDRECEVLGGIGGNQRGVQKRLVVGDDEYPVPGLAQVIKPCDFDPVKQLQQPGNEGLDQSAGQQARDIDGHCQVQQCNHQKDLGDTQIK